MSRRIVDRVYLKKSTGGSGSFSKIEVYGTQRKEERAQCGMITFFTVIMSCVAWIMSQLTLLGMKISTTPSSNSWGVTLIPTTCFLGILAFLFLGILINTRLCIQNEIEDTKGHNSDKCCNWALFGLVTFFLPAFVFMVMLSLSLDGYFDWWVAVATSVPTGILFVLIYLACCIPNKCCYYAPPNLISNV